MRVGGIGEADELQEARRLAVLDGTKTLRDRVGEEPRSLETERYTVVQLPSGKYRAFVVMSGRN